jgi:hypothetical protein
MSAYFPAMTKLLWLDPVQSQSPFSTRDIARAGILGHMLGLTPLRCSKQGIYRPAAGGTLRAVSVDFQQGTAQPVGSGMVDGRIMQQLF